MNDPAPHVIDRIIKPNGFEFDLQEGFRKLISSQFGGYPARGACELIQNAIDSYPASVPFEDRRIDLITTSDSFCVRDEGEGMSLERLNLLATLGGTDKHLDPDKIGRFGIGFFSVFNPRLCTTRVVVRTRCESSIVGLEFLVDPQQPERAPTLKTDVRSCPRGEKGSAITVFFARPRSVGECAREAEKFLNFFPCRVAIDGTPFTRTVWLEARKAGARFFQAESRQGFIRTDQSGDRISILCKYEHILEFSAAYLSTGGHGVTGHLDDFRRRRIPLLRAARTVVNDNRLNVTVSRDSVILDRNYEAMVDTLRDAYLAELHASLEKNLDPHLALANQYIFAEAVRRQLAVPGLPVTAGTVAAATLVEAPVYRLDGRSAPVSLRYLWEHLPDGQPLFYSPSGHHVKWLGGAFEHDFVVVPLPCRHFFKQSECYDLLFARIFEDCVNLDTVRDQPGVIQNLVARGIVSPELLAPRCEMVALRDTTPEERQFLGEITALLADPGVMGIVRENLHLAIRSIETVLFDLRENGLVVAAGLFGEDGRLLQGSESDPIHDAAVAPRPRRLQLGLMRSHPVIRHLINSGDPFRSYYALTYLARELVGCQRMLVPGSSFSNWLVRELARQIRAMIVDRLLAKPGPDASSPS